MLVSITPKICTEAASSLRSSRSRSSTLNTALVTGTQKRLQPFNSDAYLEHSLISLFRNVVDARIQHEREQVEDDVRMAAKNTVRRIAVHTEVAELVTEIASTFKPTVMSEYPPELMSEHTTEVLCE